MADFDATTQDEAPPAAVPASAFEGTSSDAGSGGGESPLSVGSEDDPFAERPEVYVGAAFAGGFVLAKILGKLRSS